MQFFIYISPICSCVIFPSTEPFNPLGNLRIREKPVFCNILTVIQESNSRNNQLIDKANNLYSENGALNRWLVFMIFLPTLSSSILILLQYY